MIAPEPRQMQIAAEERLTRPDIPASGSPGLRRFAAVWQRLLYAALFLLPLVWWPTLANPFSTPKIWFLAGLAAVGCSICMLERPYRPRSFHWTCFAWFGAAAVTSAIAPYVSAQALILSVLPLPLYWAIRTGNCSRVTVVRALIAASAVESAIVALQYAGLDPLQYFGWHPEQFASGRMQVYGTLGNPNFVAAFLCGSLPLYAELAPATSKRRIYLRWAIGALQVSAILATGSRVLLLALAVYALAALLRGSRAAKLWVAGLALAAAGLASGLLWTSSRPLGTTIEGRLYAPRVILSRCWEIPATGFGPGSFELHFARFQAEWLRAGGVNSGAARFAGPLDHAHNDYLEIWLEYGIIGLAAFLVIPLLLLVSLRRSARASNGALVGAVTLMAIALVDFPFHRPAAWTLFWVLLALAGLEQAHLPASNSKTAGRAPAHVQDD